MRVFLCMFICMVSLPLIDFNTHVQSASFAQSLYKMS